MRRNTLLIDADDTLWENNVFFENLIEDFITLVESCGFTRAYVRHILNETERKNIRQYGYGVRSFGRSLEETYLKPAQRHQSRHADRPERRLHPARAYLATRTRAGRLRLRQTRHPSILSRAPRPLLIQHSPSLVTVQHAACAAISSFYYHKR